MWRAIFNKILKNIYSNFTRIFSLHFFLVMAFNPDGMSELELYMLFSNRDTAFKFALEADMLADGAFCSEECEWILTTL